MSYPRLTVPEFNALAGHMLIALFATFTFLIIEGYHWFYWCNQFWEYTWFNEGLLRIWHVIRQYEICNCNILDWLTHYLNIFFALREQVPFACRCYYWNVRRSTPIIFIAANRGQIRLRLPQATNSPRTISVDCPRNYKRYSQKHRADPHELRHGKHAYYPNITQMPITASLCSSGHHIESFAIPNT